MTSEPTAPAQELTIVPPQSPHPVPRQSFSVGDLQLIKDTIAKGASDQELKLFAQVCKTTGLNPFARQIYAVMRWDGKLQREVMAMQTGIDGYRLIAERSGRYTGQLGPYWCDDSGEWSEVWLDLEHAPFAAKVGVMRNDFTEPIWAIARFKSYVQITGRGEIMGMWNRMPDLMIAKCAEALALRRAFPNELSGIYVEEEMQAIDEAEPEHPKAELPEPQAAATKSPARKPTARAKPAAKAEQPPAAPEQPAQEPAADRTTEPAQPAEQRTLATPQGEPVPEGPIDQLQVSAIRNLIKDMDPVIQAEVVAAISPAAVTQEGQLLLGELSGAQAAELIKKLQS